MQELTLDIKDFEFNSNIKFYYSLLYISETDLKNLKKYFGENINLFNEEVLLTLPATEYYPLKSNLQRVRKIYDQIKLSDEEILRLFHSNEIINCLKQFLKSHENKFDYNNLKDIESFYSYLVLSKIEKHILYGTLWEFFRTCNQAEVQNAIDSLDFMMKRNFSKMFGENGEEKTVFRANQTVKNTILIELYNHILLHRKPINVISIIESLDQDITFKQMKLMDYIRSVRNDSTLTDNQIIKFISELDYKSRGFLKEIYGDDYDQKGVVYNSKRFDVIIEKINKLMDNNGEIQSIKKEKKRRTKTKEKKETLQDFLKNNNITEEAFNKALNLLSDYQKNCIEYFFGLKDDGKLLNYSEIASKLDKSEVNIRSAIFSARKRILKLIETGKINKSNKESKKPSTDGKTEQDPLDEFLKANNIIKEDFDKALIRLNKNQQKLLNYYFGLKDEKALTIEEISIKENKTYSAIYQAIKAAKKRVVLLITSGKISEPIIEKTNDNIKRKRENINEFLKANNIIKEDFDKALIRLNKNQQKLLNYYFGLKDEKALTIEEISIKESKTYSAIYQAIKAAKKRLISLIKTGRINELTTKEKKAILKKEKNKKLKDQYGYFLKENDITKEQFMQACEFLTKNRKKILYLHFGIEEDSTPMSNNEIALLFNKTKNNISQSITFAKKQVVEMIKSGKMTELINNEKFKKINTKLNSVYKSLLKEEKFRKLVAHTSPIGATVLSLIANFNFSLDELSVALVVDKETVIELLMSVSTIAIEYIQNPLYSGTIDFNDLNVEKDPTYIIKEGINQEG